MEETTVTTVEETTVITVEETTVTTLEETTVTTVDYEKESYQTLKNIELTQYYFFGFIIILLVLWLAKVIIKSIWINSKD